jgi:hypothetical protein
MAELGEKFFQRRRRSLCLHLHGAIVAIADVAVEPEPSSLPFGEEAEPDALNITKDFRL